MNPFEERWMPRQFRWDDLLRMPTIHVGQYADMKIDTGTTRVWVSRMRIHDGETQPVQVEKLRGGRWVDVTDPGDGHSINEVPLDGDYEGHTVYCLTRRLAEAR
jgi:hypothetical protein